MCKANYTVTGKAVVVQSMVRLLMRCVYCYPQAHWPLKDVQGTAMSGKTDIVAQ